MELFMVYLSTDQRDILVAGLDTFHFVQKKRFRWGGKNKDEKCCR